MTETEVVVKEGETKAQDGDLVESVMESSEDKDLVQSIVKLSKGLGELSIKDNTKPEEELKFESKEKKIESKEKKKKTSKSYESFRLADVSFLGKIDCSNLLGSI